MRARDQGLRRCVECPSLLILSAWLEKGLNSLVFNLGLAEQWVMLGDLLRFRVNVPVCRHKFWVSCLCEEGGCMSTEAKEAPELRCFSVPVTPYSALPVTQPTYIGTFLLQLYPTRPSFNRYFCKVNCNYFWDCNFSVKLGWAWITNSELPGRAQCFKYKAVV